MEGKNLKRWRIDHKLSIEDLASKVGVSWHTITRWERGDKPQSKAVKEKLEEVIKKEGKLCH